MTKRQLCLLMGGLLLSPAVLAEDLTPQLKLNGFATAGATWLDNNNGGAYLENSYGRAGITENVNTSYDTVAGLQFDYQVNDKTDLVTQLVASGAEDFKISTTWAYIRYELDNNWSFRAGRIGFAGFMYSDTINVGHSYPWVRPPAEVYASTPLNSLQGVGANYRTNFGDWTFNGELWGGAGASTGNVFRLDNARMAVASLSTSDLLLRLSYTAATLDSHFNLPLNANSNVNAQLNYSIDFHDIEASFSDFGFLYDNSAWLLGGEVALQKTETWPADFLGGYLTAGHYFGKVLPYLTWGKVDTLNSDNKVVGAKLMPASMGTNALPAGYPIPLYHVSMYEQETYSAGLRWDVRSGLSLKAQVDHIMPKGQYDGIFRFPNGALPAAAPRHIEDTNLYSLTANVVF